MAISRVTKTYSASLNGLVTDGNALANTEQSNLSESNYEILRDGTRRRRRPILFESGTPDEGPLNWASTYLWKTPNHQTGYSILIEQQDEILNFYPVDHTDPQYMHHTRASLLPINLYYWGEAQKKALTELSSPCTYTEGNGALYVFQRETGTIKIELLEDGLLRATPIGTWVRDYEGATEQVNADHRIVIEETLDEWAAGSPYLDTSSDYEFQITEELPATRAYNLSNTGWDARSLASFAEQSSKDYATRDPTTLFILETSEVTTTDTGRFGVITHVDNPPLYPALTDRYTSGRLVGEDGDDTFSFPQLVQARENKSVPGMGARVRHSAIHPAGSLSGLPNDSLDSVTSVSWDATLGTATIQLTFDVPLVHAEGRLQEQLALFIHYMTFSSIDVDGTASDGGFSGVLDTQLTLGTEGKEATITYTNQRLAGNPSFDLTGLYVHSSPEHFPHQIPDDPAAYDFRDSYRPRSGEYYQGRLWQTGDKTSRLYFSQQVQAGTQTGATRGIAKESMCYASADPTDPDDSTLVATDGGYLNLPDSGTAYGLEKMGNLLVLLTDNGMWVISPGQQGFDFQISKISDAEVLGPRAFTRVETELHVSTNEGILKIGIGENGIQLESLTDQRIRYEYDDILSDGREAVGAYDPETRSVRWVFSQETGVVIPEDVRQTVMLTYSLVHSAWYRYDLSSRHLVLDMVVIPYTAKSETYNRFRYLVSFKDADIIQESPPALLANYRLGWAVEAEFGEDGTADWVLIHDTSIRFNDFDFPGDPMPAFMETNHVTNSAGLGFENIHYLVAYNRNVTTNFIADADGGLSENVPGSTLVSARWDWMDRAHTGKFSPSHETYRFRKSYFAVDEEETRGEPVLVSKVKVRGRGREFRLYWESNEQNDSHIEGWAIIGNQMEDV